MLYIVRIAIFPQLQWKYFNTSSCILEGTPDNDDASTDWFNIVNDVNLATSNVYNKTFTINANWIRCLTYRQR